MYRSELECPNFFEDAHVTLEKAWMKTDHIILLGHFNCDLLNTFRETGSDVRGKTRKLLHLFEQFDLQNIVEEPTRVTLETKTLIDLIVTNKPELFNIKGVLPVVISDHSLPYATIKLRQRCPHPRIITIRNFKNFSIKEFQADLSCVPFHVADVFEDKDGVQWAWSLMFNEICDKHAPFKKSKIRSKSDPWITNEIRRKMNYRYKLLKSAVNTKDEIAWANYKKVRNEITGDLRRAKSRFFCEKINSAKSTAAYWKVLSKAANPKRRQHIGPIRRDDKTLTVRDDEKANLMNVFFATVGIEISRNPSCTRKAVSNDGSPVQTISSCSIPEESVSRKIKALKPNKAVGPDGITPKLLRLAEPAIVSPLTKLYARSITKGEVYNQWKKAHLCPVFKKDDPTDKSNYRPISLLSVPSKILESCISDTMLKHVTECDLLTEKQWAYRKGHSTELLLVHLTESWRQAVDNNLVVATAFIDFRKAFDRVSHRTLLLKLRIKFGIEGNLLSWLTDYLHHRTQVTVVNSTQSEELNVTCGIPQGAVLGPCLFSLYTNDMPEAVISGNLYLYADDTTVYCIGSTVDELNNVLNELNKWCMTNSLTPHYSKCEVMLFHRGSFTGPLPLITIGNVNIAWVYLTRLLGITLDRIGRIILRN